MIITAAPTADAVTISEVRLTMAGGGGDGSGRVGGMRGCGHTGGWGEEGAGKAGGGGWEGDGHGWRGGGGRVGGCGGVRGGWGGCGVLINTRAPQSAQSLPSEQKENSLPAPDSGYHRSEKEGCRGRGAWCNLGGWVCLAPGGAT